MSWSASEQIRWLAPDGRVYTVVTITETSVRQNDEWGPIFVPPVGTLTLVETVLEEAGESVTAIQVELGSAGGWYVDSMAHVGRSTNAGRSVRLDGGLRYIAPGGQLWGRSRPNAVAPAVRVVTRLTWVGGHA